MPIKPRTTICLHLQKSSPNLVSAQTTQHPPSIPRASKQKWKLTSDLPAQKADNQCNLLHQATYNYNKHDDPETQPVKRLRQLPIFILVALLASITFSTSTLAANRDEVIFFFNDALGSAVAAVNESGELCWSEQYTGYGDKTINDDLFNVTGCGIVGEERGFTGYTEDVNSDLVYMQQRYYDPSIGRFLSIDPVAINPEEPTTYNRYAYANNNPHKYVDPDGRFAETAWDVFNVALGAASFLSNISEGNYGSAALDAVGVVIDSAAAITPIAFGGVGTLINSRRLADVTNKADDFVYRGGSGTPTNFTPRPKDTGGRCLST